MVYAKQYQLLLLDILSSRSTRTIHGICLA